MLISLMMDKRKKRWSVPVSEELDKWVELAVERDWHSTKADLIREAVRKEIERMGIRQRAE